MVNGEMNQILNKYGTIFQFVSLRAFPFSATLKMLNAQNGERRPPHRLKSNYFPNLISAREAFSFWTSSTRTELVLHSLSFEKVRIFSKYYLHMLEATHVSCHPAFRPEEMVVYQSPAFD